MAVEKIFSVASIDAKTLQGQTTLVSQKRESLEKLVSTLTDDFGVQHVSDSESEALGADENPIVSDDGRFGVSVESIFGFLDDLGTSFVDYVEALEAEELRYLFLNLGHSVMKLICSIVSISAERDPRNEAEAALPAVLPHELVKLRGRYFRIIVRTHCDRLLTCWSISKIDRIEQEFEEIIVANLSEEAFKKSLDECDCYMGFKDGRYQTWTMRAME